VLQAGALDNLAQFVNNSAFWRLLKALPSRRCYCYKNQLGNNAMEDFAKSVAQEHGIDESMVQNVMNKVLQFFKEKPPKEVSDSIAENVPAVEGVPKTNNNPCMPSWNCSRNFCHSLAWTMLHKLWNVVKLPLRDARFHP